MNDKQDRKNERVMRETLPTISFTAYLSHKTWIDRQAQAQNKSKSEIIREALDNAMAAAKPQAA